MTARFDRIPDGYVQVVDNSLAGGEAALRAVLELDDQPTAVVTSTDLVAVGVLHAAYNMRCVVPDELSVVGFDDLLLAAHTVPALTTAADAHRRDRRRERRARDRAGAGSGRLARAPANGLRTDARRAPVDGPTLSPGGHPPAMTA